MPLDGSPRRRSRRRRQKALSSEAEPDLLERVGAMPWLAAPFRPFYLLGVGYAIALMALAGFGFAGVAPGAFPMAWHGHEMIFGFALAIIAGTVLSALPSWAGTAETRGRTLALLAASWLLGRAACFFAPGLPWGWVAAFDVALPLALIAHLTPRLMRLPQRRWRLPLAVFALLAVTNLAWHAAFAAGDAALAARALRAALWVVVAMYTLAGGLFTPVFTANVLTERGRGAPHPASLPLEVAALLAVVALALADVMGVQPALAPLALAAFVLQAWRVARWRGWRAADDALVGAMHLGFLWLLAALMLKALVHLGVDWPEASWVHAFTAGALGSMMLGLMTRVVLRHTGRALIAPPVLPLLLLSVNVAAMLRVAAPALGTWAWPAASLLWALAFGTWLVPHARMMWRASLPHLPRTGP